MTYVCSPNLVRLFEGLGVELVPASQAPPPAQADYWVPDMSLGLRLGVTLETLSGAAYLTNGTVTTGGGVGIMVGASQTGPNAANKTLSGAASRELLALGCDLSPEATGALDFRETAEIIAGLDLVISADTAVAHLAAAMGKPTWILIPALDTDWRWLSERTDSPWYETARLYRQARGDDWRAVVQQVLADARAGGLA